MCRLQLWTAQNVNVHKTEVFEDAILGCLIIDLGTFHLCMKAKEMICYTRIIEFLQCYFYNCMEFILIVHTDM